MLGLVEQIQAAREKAGWSVQKLLDESRLPIDRSVLQRKLTKETPFTSDELEACARALGITIAWAPDDSPKKKARVS